MDKKPYCKPGSLPYREAGRRFRLMHERLRDGDFPPVAWKVAFAVATLTASYSKAWDETYVSDIAALAGCDRPTASRWLPRLAEAGVLQWKPSKWNRSRSLVGLPDETCVEADTSSSLGHVSKRTRNGVRADTQPKVTAAPRAKPAPRRCGICGGAVEVEGDVVSCAAGCSWSQYV